MASFQGLNTKSIVQKYLCTKCGTSFNSNEQKKNIQFRDSIKMTINKLIIVLRFGHGMSERGISDVIKNVYGFFASIGFVDKISQQTAGEAAGKMAILNDCKQNVSKVLMFDETFPKAKDEGCINLGVAVCENGLIRKVAVINVEQKSNEILQFFQKLITKSYKPKMFLSDYDQSYPKAIRTLISSIIVLKDPVHTVRQIYKDTRSVINKTVVKFGNLSLTKEKQKSIRDLKKKLLRKQLNKVIRKMLKGFKKDYCSVGAIYIEGSLEELRDLSEKFPSIKPLYKKIKKFVKKYIKTWNDLMELHFKENIPLTSNLIESKNSIFKSFSKKAKSYSSQCLDKFFCAVALYENFSVKTRGINKGTNAMGRAGIDLEQFGANNFFEAVGIFKSMDYDFKINVKF